MTNSKQIKSEIYKAKTSIASNTTIFGSLFEDTICRVAFPSYRVFIFGQEVTEDVIAVRLSQSGGSAERSAGSCMLTLLNKGDKYIYTHDDMVRISKYKSTLGKVPAKQGDGGKSAVLNINGIDKDPGELYELAKKLKDADADQTSYWLQALFGSIAEDKAKADVLARQIIKFVDESTLNSTTAYDNILEYESGAYGSSSWSMVKGDVFDRKITQRTDTPDPKFNDPKISHSSNPKSRSTFHFPMYEGDCIFNPNDPIRVAFRDPFEPTIWYWMFAGFMDSFTEEFSEDKESIISISCTDVCKILRYSTIQSNLGKTGQAGISRDDSVSGEIERLYGFSNIKNYVSDTGMYYTAKLFDSLTALEILEILFFGSDSTRNLVETKYTDRVSSEMSLKLVEDIRKSYGTVDKGGNKSEPTMLDIYEYLVNALKVDPVVANEIFRDYAGFFDKEAKTGWSAEVLDVIKNNVKSLKTATLNNFTFPPLTFPGDVVLKRRGNGLGVHFYVIGKPDFIDRSLGAEEVKTLKEWNELIHHRVRKTDLVDMFNSNVETASPAKIESAKLKYQEIYDVVTLIGTHIDDYPVGGGRLYYLTFSEIENATERSILDRSVGGPGADLHSSYIDRLTLLYDLAKNIDFRFYATPRGDFVFEFPFYDFDPNMFWGDENDLRLNNKREEQLTNYETVFTEAYSGKYTEDETYKSLTGLQFLINSETGMLENPLQGYGGDDYYSYASVFSIGNEDMISFSNTLNDQGMITVAVAKPNVIGLYSGVDSAKQLANYHNAYAAELIPRLGVRVAVDDAWSFVSSPEAATMSANLMLNSTNSNCRNCGIRVIPRFGMMVNRPMIWRFRNQVGNILSIDHSISWNSDASTSLSVNNVRAWNGMTDVDGSYVYQKFGGETMFNWKDLVLRSGSFKSPKRGDNVDSERNNDKSNQGSYDENFNENVDPESIF